MTGYVFIVIDTRYKELWKVLESTLRRGEGDMKYPTMKEIHEADIKQLSEWRKVLHGPGYFALGMPGFSKILADEMACFVRINARYKELWEALESTLIGGKV